MIEKIPKFEREGKFEKGDTVKLREEVFEKTKKMHGSTRTGAFQAGVEYVVVHFDTEENMVLIGPADMSQEDIDGFTMREYMRPRGGKYPYVSEFRPDELRHAE